VQPHSNHRYYAATTSYKLIKKVLNVSIFKIGKEIRVNFYKNKES